MKERFLKWIIKRYLLPMLNDGFLKIAPHYWKKWELVGVPEKLKSNEMSLYLTREGSIMVRCRFVPYTYDWDASEELLYFPFRVLFSESEMNNHILSQYGGKR